MDWTNPSIARAIRQLREDKKLTREDVVTGFANRGQKRSLTTVRSWETSGSIKLPDVMMLVEQILKVKWSDFEKEVARQEAMAPKPKRPKRKPPAGSRAEATLA